MKTVTVTFPIEEAVDIIRLLRAESRCLIENGDVMPDADVVKRAQNVLSARERIVSELEVIAEVEDMPQPLPEGAMDLTKPNRPHMPEVDAALAAATSCEVIDENLAIKHGVPTIEVGGDPMRRATGVERDWEKPDFIDHES